MLQELTKEDVSLFLELKTEIKKYFFALLAKSGLESNLKRTELLTNKAIEYLESCSGQDAKIIKQYLVASEDLKKSFQEYTIASDRGYAVAQRLIGDIYYAWRWYKEAFHYYNLAAEQNEPFALNVLGDCYYSGRGCKQDQKKALHYYKLAAEQDLAAAHYSVAYCHYYELGCERAPILELEHFYFAYKYGDSRAFSYLKSLYDPKTRNRVMHLAVLSKYPEIICALKDCIHWLWIVTYNKDGYTPLILAIKENNFNAVESLLALKNNDHELLLEKKDNFGDTPLSIALNPASVYKFLLLSELKPGQLPKKNEIYIATTEDEAILKGVCLDPKNPNKSKEFLLAYNLGIKLPEHTSFMAPWKLVLSRNKAKIIELLIQQGLIEGTQKIYRALFKAGVSLSMPVGNYEVPPIHIAYKVGGIALVEEMLECSIERCRIAKAEGKQPVVDKDIICLDQTNTFGRNLLHFAIEDQDEEAVHFLLENGAKPNFLNSAYLISPWQLAENNYIKSQEDEGFLALLSVPSSPISSITSEDSSILSLASPNSSNVSIATVSSPRSDEPSVEKNILDLFNDLEKGCAFLELPELTQIPTWLVEENNIPCLIFYTDFNFCLMSDLENRDPVKAKENTLYLESNGNYLVRNPKNGNVQEACLFDESDKRCIEDLEKVICDPIIQAKLLKITAAKGHTLPLYIKGFKQDKIAEHKDFFKEIEKHTKVKPLIIKDQWANLLYKSELEAELQPYLELACVILEQSSICVLTETKKIAYTEAIKRCTGHKGKLHKIKAYRSQLALTTAVGYLKSKEKVDKIRAAYVYDSLDTLYYVNKYEDVKPLSLTALEKKQIQKILKLKKPEYTQDYIVYAHNMKPQELKALHDVLNFELHKIYEKDKISMLTPLWVYLGEQVSYVERLEKNPVAFYGNGAITLSRKATVLVKKGHIASMSLILWEVGGDLASYGTQKTCLYVEKLEYPLVSDFAWGLRNTVHYGYDIPKSYIVWTCDLPFKVAGWGIAKSFKFLGANEGFQAFFYLSSKELSYQVYQVSLKEARRIAAENSGIENSDTENTEAGNTETGTDTAILPCEIERYKAQRINNAIYGRGSESFVEWVCKNELVVDTRLLFLAQNSGMVRIAAFSIELQRFVFDNSFVNQLVWKFEQFSPKLAEICQTLSKGQGPEVLERFLFGLFVNANSSYRNIRESDILEDWAISAALDFALAKEKGSPNLQAKKERSEAARKLATEAYDATPDGIAYAAYTLASLAMVKNTETDPEKLKKLKQDYEDAREVYAQTQPTKEQEHFLTECARLEDFSSVENLSSEDLEKRRHYNLYKKFSDGGTLTSEEITVLYNAGALEMRAYAIVSIINDDLKKLGINLTETELRNMLDNFNRLQEYRPQDEDLPKNIAGSYRHYTQLSEAEIDKAAQSCAQRSHDFAVGNWGGNEGKQWRLREKLGGAKKVWSAFWREIKKGSSRSKPSLSLSWGGDQATVAFNAGGQELCRYTVSTSNTAANFTFNSNTVPWDSRPFSAVGGTYFNSTANTSFNFNFNFDSFQQWQLENSLGISTSQNYNILFPLTIGLDLSDDLASSQDEINSLIISAPNQYVAPTASSGHGENNESHTVLIEDTETASEVSLVEHAPQNTTLATGLSAIGNGLASIVVGSNALADESKEQEPIASSSFVQTTLTSVTEDYNSSETEAVRGLVLGTNLNPGVYDDVGLPASDYTGPGVCYAPSASQLDYSSKTEKPSWSSMALRALKGEDSPEVRAWKQENRENMPGLAAASDGINQMRESVNKPLKDFKVELLNSIDKKIESLDLALAKPNLSGADKALIQTKKTSYQTGLFAAANILPDSVEDLSVAVLGAAMAGPILEKGGKALTVAYEAHKKGQVFSKYPPNDRIQHEALKTQYRQNSEKPLVRDKNLQNIVDELYRPNAKIGNGSTADAARLELKTNVMVKGKGHLIKSQQLIIRLEKWNRDNPIASPGDRAVAENLITDLKDALGEKPWYSQTKLP